MIDTSDAAIEADLSRAESGGTPGVIAMLIGRAQIRATLQAARATERPSFQALPAEGAPLGIQIAEGPFGDSYAVPAGASRVDRVEAAARMLSIDADELAGMIFHSRQAKEAERSIFAVEPAPIVVEAPAEPDFELDIDGSLEDAHTEDDLDEATVDEDFFADVKKARKR